MTAVAGVDSRRQAHFASPTGSGVQKPGPKLQLQQLNHPPTSLLTALNQYVSLSTLNSNAHCMAELLPPVKTTASHLGLPRLHIAAPLTDCSNQCWRNQTVRHAQLQSWNWKQQKADKAEPHHGVQQQQILSKCSQHVTAGVHSPSNVESKI
jgi:hypothetical protein